MLLAKLPAILQKTIISQIQITHKRLTDDWYGTIKEILVKGIRRKHVPNSTTRPKAAKKFMSSVAALMTQNLSDIAIKSLLMFTNFMCDYRVSMMVML